MNNGQPLIVRTSFATVDDETIFTFLIQPERADIRGYDETTHLLLAVDFRPSAPQVPKITRAKKMHTKIINKIRSGGGCTFAMIVSWLVGTEIITRTVKDRLHLSTAVLSSPTDRDTETGRRRTIREVPGHSTTFRTWNRP